MKAWGVVLLKTLAVFVLPGGVGVHGRAGSGPEARLMLTLLLDNLRRRWQERQRRKVFTYPLEDLRALGIR